MMKAKRAVAARLQFRVNNAHSFSAEKVEEAC